MREICVNQLCTVMHGNANQAIGAHSASWHSQRSIPPLATIPIKVYSGHIVNTLSGSNGAEIGLAPTDFRCELPYTRSWTAII